MMMVFRCQFDVVVGILACHKSHGVGIEHLTVDADGTGEPRHHDTVALAQDRVVVTVGICQCLVQLDGDGVGGHRDEFRYVDGVVAGVSLGGTQHTGHQFLFFLCHAAQQFGTFGIGVFGDAASLFDEVGKTLVTVGQGIVALELHLTLDGHVLLFDVVRTATDIHLVVGLQGERAFSRGDGEVGIQFETVGECRQPPWHRVR